jgi:hypothetical protein
MSTHLANSLVDMKINTNVRTLTVRKPEYITSRECEARDKALHEKLDMILDNQRRYEEAHNLKHEKLEADIEDYKKNKYRIIGGSAVLSAVAGFFAGFLK